MRESKESNMKNSVLFAFISALCLVLLAMPANAQATRTWISGVGDDANPCSRTAPCKTFAGAISKTAASGEINCLDPGGFGAVTITKSIQLICEDTIGGVLVSGTNGIVISAPGAQVRIQGLDIDGLGSGLNGINVLDVGALYVQDCLIYGFVQKGINYTPTTAGTSTLVVQNTVLSANNNAANGGAIFIAPAAGVTATVFITNTRMSNNTFGLHTNGGKTTVFESAAVNNTNNGFVAVNGGTQLDLSYSVAANNGTNGVQAVSGAAVNIAYNSIFGNATGISESGGTVTSFSPGTNANAGNGTPGAPNGTAIPLQ